MSHPGVESGFGILVKGGTYGGCTACCFISFLYLTVMEFPCRKTKVVEKEGLAWGEGEGKDCVCSSPKP